METNIPFKPYESVTLADGSTAIVVKQLSEELIEIVYHDDCEGYIGNVFKWTGKVFVMANENASGTYAELASRLIPFAQKLAIEIGVPLSVSNVSLKRKSSNKASRGMTSRSRTRR